MKDNVINLDDYRKYTADDIKKALLKIYNYNPILYYVIKANTDQYTVQQLIKLSRQYD